MTLPAHIGWTPEFHLRALDQTLLPGEERYLVLDSVEAVAEAIRSLRVRGAPLIGVAAAMGVVQAGGNDLTMAMVNEACDLLVATRPTAVNLPWPM